MISSILNLDAGWTGFLYRLVPHNSFMNAFFLFFSQRGESIFIWVLFLLFLIIFEERRDKKFVVYFILSFIISGLLVNVVVKNIVKRPRPVQTFASSSCPKDFSFPSGHAAAAFASAVIFSFFDKKRKYFYFGIAMLIAYSRIYLHCHYLFDVLGGAAFGSCISYLILRLFGRRHTYS